MTQVANSVILVRPTGFGHDPETAASNSFQQAVQGPDVNRLAAEEFDGLLEALRVAGIHFTVLEPKDQAAPNGVFPNNWFSTHDDGTVVLYPMLTASRRVERDPDLARTLSVEGLKAERTTDLSGWEHRGLILEGTGSLVLDRTHKKAFACISERTTEAAVKAWCEQFGYTPITFTATFDGRIQGAPIYHTNVVMSIGEKFAVACFEAMPYPAERQELDEELRKSGKQVIPINVLQMHQFVGNMLELRSAKTNEPYILLSETAFLALAPEQRLALQAHAQLLPVPVPTIEQVGGGSVRCMLAENFLGRG
jgi:hypothetical protein